MEKRIQLERRARKANQIKDLNLDNCRSTTIVGLTDEYTLLETLSLINVGLTTLKGFPKLPNLRKLELSDNRISNGLHYLHTSPKLQYLNLSGNRLQDLEALKPLKEFKHLIVLDLFNNEATQIDNYRDKIFEMLPSLKYLDGIDCNEVEAPSSEVDEDLYMDSDDEFEEDTTDSDSCGSFDKYENVALSEVYNDDLEEDEDEWSDENAGVNNDDEDEDSDDDEDEDSDDNEVNESIVDEEGDGNAGGEEPQARGKKRKHEG